MNLEFRHPWVVNLTTAGLVATTGYASVVLVHGSALLAAAVILAAVVAALAAMGRPSLVAVLAVPCVFLVRRLGPGGGISYSDAVMAAAAVAAIIALGRTETLRSLSPALRAMAVYLAALFPSLLINHSFRGDLEFAHRLVLIGGAVLVGAWLVAEERAALALKLLLFTAVVVAIASMIYSATHGFTAAYPFQMHKNFVGGMLSTVLLLAVVAPPDMGLPQRLRVMSVLALAGGLLAAQSRGAALAACFGMLIWLVRIRFTSRGGVFSKLTRRVRIAGAVVGIALAWYAYTSISHQLIEHSAGEVTSAEVRVRVEERTREIWRTSPAVGVGLKYFNAGAWGYYAQAPNNVIDNELAESGVLGAAGFLIFQFWVLAALWRIRHPLALAALAVVAARLLHGMIDIYWTAGISTLPFVLVGMGLATGSSKGTDVPA